MRGNRENHARLRAVAQLHLRFVAAEAEQFVTPPEELLRRAEAAAAQAAAPHTGAM